MVQIYSLKVRFFCTKSVNDYSHGNNFLNARSGSNVQHELSLNLRGSRNLLKIKLSCSTLGSFKGIRSAVGATQQHRSTQITWSPSSHLQCRWRCWWHWWVWSSSWYKCSSWSCLQVSYWPVPRDTTHCTGVLGHKHLLSWMARAVGLLIKRPPSCNNITARYQVGKRFTWKETQI